MPIPSPIDRLDSYISTLTNMLAYMQSLSPTENSDLLHLSIDAYVNRLSCHHFRPNSKPLNFLCEFFLPLNSHMSSVRLDRAKNEFVDPNNTSVLNWLQQLSCGSPILLDIGANIGIYSAFALGWGFSSALAIEPHPLNFLSLIQFKYSNPHLNFLPLNAACDTTNNLNISDFVAFSVLNKNFAGVSHIFSDSLTANLTSDPIIVAPSFSVLFLIRQLKLWHLVAK